MTNPEEVKKKPMPPLVEHGERLDTVSQEEIARVGHDGKAEPFVIEADDINEE